MWEREKKDRKPAAPEIPCATAAAWHVEGGRGDLSSSHPRPSPPPPPPFPPARPRPEPAAVPREARRRHDFPLFRCGAELLQESGREDSTPEDMDASRSRQPPPPRSLAWPRRHGFPSLCPRLANHQAARVGTRIIDRHSQPIIERQRAVRGTRALLKEATVGRKRAAGACGAAAEAVATPRACGAARPP